MAQINKKEMNWFKNIFKKPVKQWDTRDIFYCEIETNPAQGKCREQCHSCKEVREAQIEQYLYENR